ncbi:desmethyl-deoxy-podophyllotoxin synthase-like [Gastrolobium bilobum]|uniref:desmethyl-deoxy-podophyllotoxin synthase-like n=1 Tax=Gastrolobium bilobum TaxID=150636 RepID=UPI002AB21207|nr:desmethyl-deoxy-podophyllotoxin synthase-like [Gastrolobium bilobum]
MAKEVMKTHDAIFANRPHHLSSKSFSYDNTDITFCPHGSHWRQLKKLCTSKLLNAKKVQSFRLIREEEVSKLIRNIFANEGSIVNLSMQIVLMANDIISRAAFGKKCRDQVAFFSALGQMSKMLAGFSIVDYYPSIKVLPLLTGMKALVERVRRESDRVLENILKDLEENYKSSHGVLEDDLFHVLLKNHKIDDLENPITHNIIKAIMWVSNSVCYSVYHFPYLVLKSYMTLFFSCKYT